MKKALKFLSLGMAMVMCLSMAATPAFAADHEATAPGDYGVGVVLTTGSSYTVKIPKNITLNSTSKTGTYSVVVTGDIAGNEQITVTPDETFAMKQNGKEDITATVTQNATVVDVDGAATGTTLTGSIDATAASAGSWNGTLNFNVAFDTKEAEKTFNVSVSKNGIIFSLPAVKEGMTWAEAINAPGNNEGGFFSVSDGKVKVSNTQVILNNVDVLATDLIIEGGNYTIR